MNCKKLLALVFTLSQVLLALEAGAQCPGPSQRTALLNLQRANILGGTRAGQIALTDTCGNQRYVRQVQINLDTINYIPTQTGNTANLSEFVFDTLGGLWYIDWKGDAIELQEGGARCDQDWLQISDASCPDAITDSIYHQKYAAIGARYVWPGATLLVNDSSSVNGALMVVQGDRTVKIALYDLANETWSMLHANGTDLAAYVPNDGSFQVTTSTGTPETATADVQHFQVNTLDSTVTINQYPNTRTDTQTVANFLYTDDLGTIRSQSVDSFPLAGRGGIYGGSGFIPDSTSAEVSFGSFFQIAYPSGVFDPAIRVTDNPPSESRQIDLNSTNALLRVYPNNVTIEAQDGINMVSNDGTEMEGQFSCTPYYVGMQLDSTPPNAGWTRIFCSGGLARMDATTGGTPGTAVVQVTPDIAGISGPVVTIQTNFVGATYTTSGITVDTNGVQIFTGGTTGSEGQVLRARNGFARWEDTTAISAPVNIYNSNGSITTNRTATLSDTILWDIASAAGAFQVEGLNGSAFRVSDVSVHASSPGAALNLGSGTPIALSLSLDAGTARITDNRAGKVGIEYASAGYGADFTDSSLVHRRYVAEMIFDSINTNTVQPPAVENIENSNFTALKWLINEVDCSGGAISVTPPASPVIKDRFAVVDSKANAATNNITVDFSGASQKLNGSIQDFIMNCDGCYIEFVYMGSTTGWISTK